MLPPSLYLSPPFIILPPSTITPLNLLFCLFLPSQQNEVSKVKTETCSRRVPVLMWRPTDRLGSEGFLPFMVKPTVIPEGRRMVYPPELRH
jgi:hypothetical protein